MKECRSRAEGEATCWSGSLIDPKSASPGVVRRKVVCSRTLPHGDSTRRPQFRLEIPRDEAGALIEGEVSPGPLKQHCEAIPEANQENDVNEEPRQPGGEAAEVDHVQIGDS